MRPGRRVDVVRLRSSGPAWLVNDERVSIRARRDEADVLHGALVFLVPGDQALVEAPPVELSTPCKLTNRVARDAPDLPKERDQLGGRHGIEANVDERRNPPERRPYGPVLGETEHALGTQHDAKPTQIATDLLGRHSDPPCNRDRREAQRAVKETKPARWARKPWGCLHMPIPSRALGDPVKAVARTAGATIDHPRAWTEVEALVPSVRGRRERSVRGMAWSGSITPMPKNTTKRTKSVSTHPAVSRPPWRVIVRAALQRSGGQAPLSELYAEIERVCPRAWLSTHWKPKSRQVVQLDPMIERVAMGVWRLKANGT